MGCNDHDHRYSSLHIVSPHILDVLGMVGTASVVVMVRSIQKQDEIKRRKGIPDGLIYGITLN